jgi:hypothetical protein
MADFSSVQGFVQSLRNARLRMQGKTHPAIPLLTVASIPFLTMARRLRQVL